jgi:DNA adenine methylase
MRALFGRPGGKKVLLKRLLAAMPRHEIYVEPFAGAAGLLFAKPPSPWEVLNDVDAEVLNFFRVAKHRPSALAERFESEIVHAGRFRELRAADAPPDEVDRALRFAYLTWFSFGSRQQHFGSTKAAHFGSVGSPTRRSLDEVRALLVRAANRLSRVLIEERDFAVCLERWESRRTFFYLDPPYVGTHGQQGVYSELSVARHAELAARLRKLRAKWLLSYNDCQMVRSLYRGFRIERVWVRQMLQAGPNDKRRAELLIRNY